MKRIVLLLTAIFSIAMHGNTQQYTTTNLDYFTNVTFPAGYAVGDYIEFVKANPMSAWASGNYEISITYTRGNMAAAATFMASLSHSNPAIWREAGKVNSNKYLGASANFTIDCNTEYTNPRFRVRAIGTGGVLTDAQVVYIRVRSINHNIAWTTLNVTGNDVTVDKYVPMTDDWNLYVGTPYSATGASLAIKALANGNVGIGNASPAHKLHVTGNVYSNGTLISDLYTNEGGAVSLINNMKTGTNANVWKIFNMTGGYGNSLKFWKYSADATVSAPQFTLNDNGSSFFTGTLGIGVAAPATAFHVLGQAREPASEGTVIIGATTGPNLRMGYNANFSWIQSHGPAPLYINDIGTNVILTRTAGSVGIGTASPIAKLHVAGGSASTYSQFMDGTAITGLLGKGTAFTGGWSNLPDVLALTYKERDFVIGGWRKSDGVWNGASLYINSDNGNVLIGKTAQTNSNYKLDVNGIIRANKLVVNTTGADFVFEKGYHLPSLDSVEQYVKANQHLPGIAPAADMQKEGVEVGEQQTKLLQKIEELTLYIIEQNKKIEKQGAQLQQQGEEIKQLKAKLK